jgi:hypothetical protein
MNGRGIILPHYPAFSVKEEKQCPFIPSKAVRILKTL